jgi:hypothetical protein
MAAKNTFLRAFLAAVALALISVPQAIAYPLG